ncbi:MAG: malectin domain-containing carbohydrate-binding protein, partial [Armatimonadota bacterium]
FPVIVGDTIYAQPMAYDLKTGAPKGRSDPLTGQETPWTFVRAYGCGAVSAAPNLLLFRSGTFGFYDLAGDSGIHNFGGIRPGCFVNMIAASGLVLIPEGSSACTCAYNFQTSVALAPTRKQEDWGVFSGVMPSGRVRRLAVNLGAPGDKRDEDGTMWLGFPRPSFHAAVRVPLVTDIRSEPRYYRRNADEVVVKRTTRPWLYASGATDVRSIVTSLMIPRRVAAVPCPQPPKIDGTLDDSCWDEEAALTLTDDAQNLDRSARAFLCQDDDNLYVAFDRRGVEGAGEPLKLTMRTGGEDAPVWNDDSWEVFLSDARRAGYVQLGASASGARFDGAYKYASDKSVNPGWNGQWTCAKSVRPDGWTLEMAIPWATLADAGLARDRLTINIRGHNRTGTGPAVVRLTDPGSRGFGRCERFVPVVVGRPEPSEPHRYTVRLHFAEPGGAKPGQRVFDVRLQGKTVLRGFDIVTEASGPGAALVKEFDGVRASGTMQIDFVPKTEAPSLARAAIISAVELIAEEGS